MLPTRNRSSNVNSGTAFSVAVGQFSFAPMWIEGKCIGQTIREIHKCPTLPPRKPQTRDKAMNRQSAKTLAFQSSQGGLDTLKTQCMSACIHHGCLDAWMPGWLAGWLDGWMDGWMEGWICFARARARVYLYIKEQQIHKQTQKHTHVPLSIFL